MKLNFSYILHELLTEATPDEIYKKYYSNIDFKNFFKVVSSDPQTIVKNGVLAKIGKFSKLLLKLHLEGNLKNEDLPKATEYLGLVYKHNISVDLKKIQSLSDLFQIVRKYYVTNTKDLHKLFDLLDKKEYNTLFSGEKWLIYEPLSEKAACYIGVGTQWCTSWGPYSTEDSYQDRSNRFSSHNNQGKLYILINKRDNKEKYQFHFETEQFMDVHDHEIYLPDFFNENPEVKYFFYPSLLDNINPSTYDVEIKRLSWLDPQDSMTLLSRNSDERFKTSKLINAIINEDGGTLNELVTTRYGDILFDEGVMFFNAKEGGNVVDSYISNLDYLSSLSRDIVDELNDYIRDDDFNDGEVLVDLIKEYHSDNVDSIMSNLGKRFSDFNVFMSVYGRVAKNDTDFEEIYRDKFVDLNEDDVRAKVDSDLKKYEHYLTIDRYREKITLPISYVILLCVEQELYEKIEDFRGFLDDYAEKYESEDEYYNLYEMNLNYPSYKDMEYEITSYFDLIIDKDDDVDKDECYEVSKIFDEIYVKYFGKNNTIENEEIIFTINTPYIKCEDGGLVNVTYTNKKTGQKSTSDIHVQDIVPYVTNHKLFETYLTFKKNIT